MKLTKSQLNKLIREEFINTLSEQDEIDDSMLNTLSADDIKQLMDNMEAKMRKLEQNMAHLKQAYEKQRERNDRILKHRQTGASI